MMPSVDMPTPMEKPQFDSIASGENGIVGSHLSAVRYHYLPAADEAGYPGAGEGVDSDISAVVLEFGDRGRRTITWAMQREVQGLSILGNEVAYAGLADETVQATDREAWRSHVGERVAWLGTAWHVSADGCPETLWALRLDFSAGSVVLALGSSNPAVEYMPDELVVLFDRKLAQTYRPRHAADSAWGR